MIGQVKVRDAVELLAVDDLRALGATTWADLGCGEGTFTLALAERLAAGSMIHAIDRDWRALTKIPAHHRGVRILSHRGDFTRQPWPFVDLDGVLMANSLHYVSDPAAFICQCNAWMKPNRRFIVVEYDCDRTNPWVPHPINRARLAALFEVAGYSSFRLLGSRPSVYQRAPLYAAMIS